tara:strand:- start:57 stop:374 length:318 start_codon:yes stop_codon:yes gene_type:complete
MTSNPFNTGQETTTDRPRQSWDKMWSSIEADYAANDNKHRQAEQDLHDLLVILIVGMDKFRMSNTKYRYLVDLILNKGWTVRDAIKRIQTNDYDEDWHKYYPKGH